MTLVCKTAIYLHAKPKHGGGGDSAGPRMPTTPPPQRGLRPTVSCQRYEPKELMGAKGAQLYTSTKSTTLSA